MKQKILIIEDEKVLSELLEKKIKEDGYEVFIAMDGEEGLELMKKEKPDLVLLDIIMPRMDGFRVMEEMNKDPELNLKKIPVVIVSNSGQPVEIDRALDLGVRDYLIKTQFDPMEVIDKIKKQIGSPEE
ncbi:MAG: response regulator [Candidatus Andersenbacteria bacterium]|nr:response regulator [Candidatus Andersenbacteria bacterium]